MLPNADASRAAVARRVSSRREERPREAARPALAFQGAIIGRPPRGMLHPWSVFSTIKRNQARRSTRRPTFGTCRYADGVNRPLLFRASKDSTAQPAPWLSVPLLAVSPLAASLQDGKHGMGSWHAIAGIRTLLLQEAPLFPARWVLETSPDACNIIAPPPCLPDSQIVRLFEQSFPHRPRKPTKRTATAEHEACTLPEPL
ncbi:hypothetical protein K458DRAFT_386459 [Lentithecium fluviatile CBS 122367]|uniref:Uncharacterized protein n=1 Tax=Lentithecium fluviatile CBS 122367 TaxID=1168545 RepID=A0A6G1J8F0_9PLEO|nr:hypothetical protein K458DRAFT_386459 [Lentithecium fluviatile CBS 122367]